MDSPLRFALGNSVWTRALFDGSVRVPGFDVEFPAQVSLPDRLYGVRTGAFAGGDPTFTDCILDRANGTSGQLAKVLPVFLICGFRQRTLLMRRDGPSPRHLAGQVVCIPRVLTPGGVWMRGFLQDEYGIRREQIKWLTAHSSTGDADWPHVFKRLDYPEGIEGIRAATEMLSQGNIAALVHPGVHDAHSLFGQDDMVEPTLAKYPNLWSPLGDPEAIAEYFKRSGVYPLVHSLAVQERIVEEAPALVPALTEAFTEARRRAVTYMTPQQRELQERFEAMLGCDPAAYELGPRQRHSLETLIRYLDEDGLLRRKPALEELFA